MSRENYALIAADLKRDFDMGRYSVPEYRARIDALNRRYAKQSRKLDKRKRAA